MPGSPRASCFTIMNRIRAFLLLKAPKVISRALDAGYEPVSLLMEPEHVEGEAREVVSRCGGIPVYTAEARILTELTGFQLTRGVLCAMRRRRLPDAASLCAGARRVAVLENVMNPTNVGAIFRSAAALGMDAVLLTPGCSDPLYRRACTGQHGPQCSRCPGLFLTGSSVLGRRGGWRS